MIIVSKMLDTISLSYGNQEIHLNIPKDRYNYIAPKKELNGINDSDEIKTALMDALDNPIGAQKLEILVRDKIVCYLIEDSTRSEPHKELIEASVKKLKGAEFINIIIATGSHKTYSEGNLEIIQFIKHALKEAQINNYDITINDAFNEKQFEQIGKTPAGTIIDVNKKALDCDVFFINADMKVHYFAGYSNAIKDFLPGICSYRSIEMNHSLAINPKARFGTHPFHPNLNRRDNPLAEDMWEAVKLIKDFQKSREIFVLSTINFEKQLIWTAAGDIKKVIEFGIQILDNVASFSIEPSKYLIISPGGYPQDLSLHTSQRGVDLSKEAIKEGGEILIIAECQEGIAHNQNAEKYFYQRLAMTKDLDKILNDIRQKYILYTHKAYKSAELLKKVKMIYMYTSLDRKSVESVHMKKIYDPQELIDKWLTESNEKINIINHANKIAIHPLTHFKDVTISL